jgi:nicotinamide phosphoribosyltransferase
MLTQFAKPGSVLAVVSDSYDLWNAIDNLWGDRLRQQVIDSGATVVIRPDSGDPVEIVAKTLEKLEARFGSTINQKGYRVLNSVRVIQGDGVDEESITAILKRTESLGFSTTNLAFGMGGALLQKLNRDTQKFAMKCSEVTVAGKAIAVYKDPITDSDKTSKKGRLALIKTELVYQTVAASTEDLLQVVYEDGQLVQNQSLETIRQRAWPTNG